MLQPRGPRGEFPNEFLGVITVRASNSLFPAFFLETNPIRCDDDHICDHALGRLVSLLTTYTSLPMSDAIQGICFYMFLLYVYT